MLNQQVAEKTIKSMVPTHIDREKVVRLHLHGQSTKQIAEKTGYSLMACRTLARMADQELEQMDSGIFKSLVVTEFTKLIDSHNGTHKELIEQFTCLQMARDKLTKQLRAEELRGKAKDTATLTVKSMEKQLRDTARDISSLVKTFVDNLTRMGVPQTAGGGEKEGPPDNPLQLIYSKSSKDMNSEAKRLLREQLTYLETTE